MYLGLSNSHSHSTANVGDQLIADASIDIIRDVKGEDTDIDLHFRGEDFTSRIEYVNSHEKVLLLPLVLTKSNIRQKLYPLVEDLDMLECPIVPISTAYQFFPGDHDSLRRQRLDVTTMNFLDILQPNCPNGEIPVRSDWVGSVLEQNGYDTRMVGDPAWFDPEYIGTSFQKPQRIDQLVFTPPRNELYRNQARNLLRRLSEAFPDADRIMSFHSVLTDFTRELRDFGSALGWETKYTSHDTDLLRFYMASDLHVGYRKHGHLAHLRWRKPSFVLAEDSRAVGLTETLGGGGFPAFERRFPPSVSEAIRPILDHWLFFGFEYLLQQTVLGRKRYLKREILGKPKSGVVDDTMDLIERERQDDWGMFDPIAEKIDEVYETEMKPFVSAI